MSESAAARIASTPAEACQDYRRIAAAIEYVRDHLDCQPGLEEIAAHLQLSPWHVQRLFTRWAGVSPKRFLQILTVQRAKTLLDTASPLLEVANSLGLSSGSRLYDHFVNLEAITPGDYKSRGAGLHIDYGLHDTPFGRAFIAITDRGICRLGFVEDDGATESETLIRQWPQASVTFAPSVTQPVMDTVFKLQRHADRPLSLLVTGTNFQVNVWRALLQIPPATVTSYARLARMLGRPQAARAVGQAVGANPLAFIIPCHRVIQESGGLGGYHWGLTRKQAMQVWETTYPLQE